MLQLAANDAAGQHGDAVPRYVVPAGIAAEFLREAMALDPAGVAALPYDADAQVSWMERIEGSAWADRGDIVVVTAHDTLPVTVEGINRFGLRVECVRGLLATRNVSAAITADSVASMPTDALEARITAHQKTLHRAFMYRFRGDAAQRKRLREAQLAPAAARVSSRSRLLLTLAEPAEANAWLRTLPRGEGAALDALHVMHPEWVARTKRKTADRAQVARERVKTPCRELLPRIGNPRQPAWGATRLKSAADSRLGARCGLLMGIQRVLAAADFQSAVALKGTIGPNARE